MTFEPMVRPHRGPVKTEDRRISDPQSLEAALGVSRSGFVTYHKECRIHLERIESCRPAIMARHLRTTVDALAKNFDAIIMNLEGDPDDMRVENALPNIMKRAAGALEEYLPLASQHAPAAAVRTRMDEIELMLSEGAIWLDRVLERMRSNDGQGIEARVQVLSAVFGGTLNVPFESPRSKSEQGEEEADTPEGER